jgi:hypothetical protein
MARKYTFIEYYPGGLPDNLVKRALAAADFGRYSGA